MLNKNGLLQQSLLNKIILTVGHYYGSRASNFGYYKNSYGSIDKIPYWYNKSNYLTAICDTVNKGSDHSYFTVKNISSGITAIVTLSSGAVYWYPINNTKEKTAFRSAKDGEKVTVTFDPPPTGYL